MSTIELILDGLDCGSCANKIEEKTKKIKYVGDSKIDFVNKKLTLTLLEDARKEEIICNTRAIVEKLEPHVKVFEKVKDNTSTSRSGLLSRNSSDNHKEGNHNHYSKIDKKSLTKIFLSLVIFSFPFLLGLEGQPRFLMYLISYTIIGHEVVYRAAKNLINLSPFDENFLMTLATMGAFAIGEYPEGVAVMVFYQVGELFQSMAVNHSRKSIKELIDIKAQYANLEYDKKLFKVDPKELDIEDIIVIKAGERVPVDSIILEGSTSLDTSNITGESLPRQVKEGDEILSGSINRQGLIRARVQKKYEDSTVAKILNLVENSAGKKARMENFISKFAKYYTPVVVLVAFLIFLIPTVFLGGDYSQWLYRSFVFLVISCPCALVISIPLGFFGGIGASSKQGILIKGGNYLEALNQVDTIVFDKTGTITKGVFKVTDILEYNNYKKNDILKYASYGEYFSNHPIGKAIVKKYDGKIEIENISEYVEIAGKGIGFLLGDSKIYIGNKKLLEENNIKVIESNISGSLVYVGRNREHIGTIVVSDEVKENIRENILKLRKQGIKETIILSGDKKETVESIRSIVGIDRAYGELLPQDKVEIFEDIIASKKNNKKKTIFVGDGVNDAPVLARADIGISMGSMGSDAAIEASDIVIMTDDISKINSSFKIAKFTKKVVTQNIILALSVKLMVLIIGALGMATMWQAVFADVGVSIIAIFNSIRILKVKA